MICIKRWLTAVLVILTAMVLTGCGGADSKLSPPNLHGAARASGVSAAYVAPRNGWWWNPAEGGSGYAIEVQGNQIFLSAFLYETTGAATWYVATLNQQSDGSYAGMLARYQGGQSLLGAYQAPTSANIANATLAFSSPTSGSLLVQPLAAGASRTIVLSRFPISTPTAFAAPNSSFQSGWWWNASQGGRGFFLEVQGNQAFVGAFMYDTSGQPTWYVSTASVSNANTVGGTLQQYSGGQSLTGAWRSPTVAPTSAGSIKFGFTSANSGNLTLPDGSTIPLTRFVFNNSSGGGAPTSQTPKSYVRQVVAPAFLAVYGLGVDSNGNVYGADIGNNAIKRLDAATGKVSILGAGIGEPYAVAVDLAGNVYVADTGNNAIKKIAANTGVVTTLAAGLNYPTGVAVDKAGTVYFADRKNNVVKKIAAGSSTIATVGFGFLTPHGVAVDRVGNLFVTDYGNGAIKKIAVNTGAVTTVATGIQGPMGIAVDSAGNVYFNSQDSITALHKIAADTGALSTFGSGLNFPTSVAVDAADNIYVSQFGGPPVKFDGNSQVATTIGSGVDSPTNVVADDLGNVYISDHNTQSVKRVAANTGDLSLFAPSLTKPSGLALDGIGNLYVLDDNVIKKVDPFLGQVTVLASQVGWLDGVTVDSAGNVYATQDVDYYGSNKIVKVAAGTGAVSFTSTDFGKYAYGIAIDSSGNLYVSDTDNSLVKRVDVASGRISVLGSGFDLPYGIAVDKAGNVFVADFGNNAVKKIAAGTGLVTTLASFNQPRGLWLDGHGNLYVVDGGGVTKLVAQY